VCPKSAQQQPHAPWAYGLTLDTMIIVATAVQHIVTAVKTAVIEEEKMTINKIVMAVMNLNDQSTGL